MIYDMKIINNVNIVFLRHFLSIFMKSSIMKKARRRQK